MAKDIPDYMRGFDIDDEDIDKDGCGNYMVTGDKYFEAMKHAWSRIFGVVHAEPNVQNDDLLYEYCINKSWDFNLILRPSMEMLDDYLVYLKNTGTGKDGIHNWCWKFGGFHTRHFLWRLLDAHLADLERPDDINEILNPHCYKYNIIFHAKKLHPIKQ